MSDTTHASDRLQEDKQLVESAARRVMDSITGEWGCEGKPYVPEICSAVQTIVDAVGRFGHAVEKAALDMYARAPQCYIDRKGSTVDATDDVREIAQGLLELARLLHHFPLAAAAVTSKLGSIGEREDVSA